MIDRRDPNYVELPTMCDTCGKLLHHKDKYKRKADGEIMCLDCILEELEEVEIDERERKSTQEIF